MTAKRLLNESDIQAALAGLARAMIASGPGPKSGWVLVGIHRRGVPLAHRLASIVEESAGTAIPVGSLDITFYRDDAGKAPLDPLVQDTHLPFDVTGKVVFLVDDVLFTGRTIRCALDELMDFGRPARVCLAVLVDRGGRELPIQADYCGTTVPVGKDERVDVHVSEIDGEDAVWVGPQRRGVAP